MEFQSSPSPNFLPGLPYISAGMLKRCSLFVAPASPRGERGTHEVGRGEGAKFLFGKKSKGEGVSEGVKSLYEYIESNPGQRVTHFEETLKKPGKTIERWIKILRDRKK